MAHVFVTSSNNGDDTAVVERLDGAVDGLGKGATERHVHDGLALEVALLNILQDKLHARDDVGRLAAAILVEDLDGDEVGLFGDAKGSAGDGARDVAAVAVLVGVLYDHVSIYTSIKEIRLDIPPG